MITIEFNNDEDIHVLSTPTAELRSHTTLIMMDKCTPIVYLVAGSLLFT